MESAMPSSAGSGHQSALRSAVWTPPSGGLTGPEEMASTGKKIIENSRKGEISGTIQTAKVLFSRGQFLTKEAYQSDRHSNPLTALHALLETLSSKELAQGGEDRHRKYLLARSARLYAELQLYRTLDPHSELDDRLKRKTLEMLPNAFQGHPGLEFEIERIEQACRRWNTDDVLGIRYAGSVLTVGGLAAAQSSRIIGQAIPLIINLWKEQTSSWFDKVWILNWTGGWALDDSSDLEKILSLLQESRQSVLKDKTSISHGDDLKVLMAGIDLLADLCWRGPEGMRRKLFDGHEISLCSFYNFPNADSVGEDWGGAWKVRCHAVSHIYSLQDHPDPSIQKSARRIIASHQKIEGSKTVLGLLKELEASELRECYRSQFPDEALKSYSSHDEKSPLERKLEEVARGVDKIRSQLDRQSSPAGAALACQLDAQAGLSGLFAEESRPSSAAHRAQPMPEGFSFAVPSFMSEPAKSTSNPRELPDLPLHLYGREEVVDALTRRICRTDNQKPTMTVCYGIPGIGKTSIVRQVVNCEPICGRFGQRVWFYRSDDPHQLESQFRALAIELKIEVTEDYIDDVYRALEEVAREAGHPDCLVVFDNADTEASLSKFLPKQGRVHILVTTRSNRGFNTEDPVEIRPLSTEYACSLIEQRLGKSDPDAKALATHYGEHPLGLTHACGYIVSHELSVGQFLRELPSRTTKVLESRRTDDLGVPSSVLSLWHTTFKELDQRSLALLHQLACLAPDAIPVALVKKMASSGAMETLLQRMLLQRYGEETYFIHRLLRMAVQTRMDKPKVVQEVAEALIATYVHDPETLREEETNKQLLVHGEFLAGVCEEQEKYSPDQGLLDARARVLQTMGYINLELNEGDLARWFFEQALQLDTRVHGPDSHEVALNLDGLGSSCQLLGEVERAMQVFEQALEIDEKIYGKDHLRVALRLRKLSLACTFVDMDEELYTGYGPLALRVRPRAYHLVERKRRARDYADRSLTIYRHSFRDHHPETLKAINEIGEISSDRSLETAMRVAYEFCSSNGLNEARSKHCLGLRCLERYGEQIEDPLSSASAVLPQLDQPTMRAGRDWACEYLQDALILYRKLYRPDHVVCARAAYHLSRAMAPGELREVMLKEAISIYKRSNTSGLDQHLRMQGLFEIGLDFIGTHSGIEKAIDIFETYLSTCRQVYGVGDPKMLEAWVKVIVAGQPKFRNPDGWRLSNWLLDCSTGQVGSSSPHSETWINWMGTLYSGAFETLAQLPPEHLDSELNWHLIRGLSRCDRAMRWKFYGRAVEISEQVLRKPFLYVPYLLRVIESSQRSKRSDETGIRDLYEVRGIFNRILEIKTPTDIQEKGELIQVLIVAASSAHSLSEHKLAKGLCDRALTHTEELSHAGKLDHEALDNLDRPIFYYFKLFLADFDWNSCELNWVKTVHTRIVSIALKAPREQISWIKPFLFLKTCKNLIKDQKWTRAFLDSVFDLCYDKNPPYHLDIFDYRRKLIELTRENDLGDNAWYKRFYDKIINVYKSQDPTNIPEMALIVQVDLLLSMIVGLDRPGGTAEAIEFGEQALSNVTIVDGCSGTAEECRRYVQELKARPQPWLSKLTRRAPPKEQ